MGGGTRNVLIKSFRIARLLLSSAALSALKGTGFSSYVTQAKSSRAPALKECSSTLVLQTLETASAMQT
jgi:hypothetical protein